MSAWSCDQLCPITADHISRGEESRLSSGGEALMISVPQCSPSSATCQCPSMPYVSAHQCLVPVPISATSMPHISAYQCTSMPHISAHLSCLSVSPISASQCRLSVLPISAIYQCHVSVLPFRAHQ
ncbi:unnamed protein product [Staurois parvus]|uniref:Uncharacterized protein n=1 Tax=Staurois parvus TaxID=386267 RepID=A0ABN9CML5_9NEOB|nr:unnamed protein product [Staurois parvus]